MIYDFYASRLWNRILALFGRVPYGPYVGWGRWISLKGAQGCVGPGWAGLVERGFKQVMRNRGRIHQIKEKFGGLRFYADISWELEAILERLSLSICEMCGKPGTAVNDGGWIKTLCNGCRSWKGDA